MVWRSHVTWVLYFTAVLQEGGLCGGTMFTNPLGTCSSVLRLSEHHLIPWASKSLPKEQHQVKMRICIKQQLSSLHLSSFLCQAVISWGPKCYGVLHVMTYVMTYAFMCYDLWLLIELMTYVACYDLCYDMWRIMTYDSDDVFCWVWHVMTYDLCGMLWLMTVMYSVDEVCSAPVISSISSAPCSNQFYWTVILRTHLIKVNRKKNFRQPLYSPSLFTVNVKYGECPWCR